MVSQKESQEQIKEELRNALAYFIERQKLVAQAMSELGLDLNEVAEFKSAAWSFDSKSNPAIDLEETQDSYAQKLYQVVKRASERSLAQSGVWRDGKKNEWRYFLHGGGCRLTNLATGESIDWDCPDKNSYDRHKFFDHLEWQMTSSERVEKLSFSCNVEKETLKTLINEIAV